MAKNKHEKKGEELRRQGKPQPPRKEESWWTTKTEVRNRDDERVGWKRENTKRRAQSQKPERT